MVDPYSLAYVPTSSSNSSPKVKPHTPAIREEDVPTSLRKKSKDGTNAKVLIADDGSDATRVFERMRLLGIKRHGVDNFQLLQHNSAWGAGPVDLDDLVTE